MRPNRLREKLDAGLPTLGTHILSSWPTLVELIGGAGGHYDYVEFTAEYARFSLYDLDNLGRAMEVAGIGGMIKIEQGEYTHQAMRAIGSGFQSVLFADVRDFHRAAQVVQVVQRERRVLGGELDIVVVTPGTPDQLDQRGPAGQDMGPEGGQASIELLPQAIWTHGRVPYGV